MEMHQIRYFIAAAKTRNFTRAAEMCSVSPPSLLRAINLLENEFGGRLFNRERANTHLTELGKIALPHLEQVLREADEAKQKTRGYLGRENATLTLGVMCTIAPHIFIPLTRNFRKRNPGVSLKIVDAPAAKLQDALLAGELDLAIYCLPGQATHARLHAMALFDEMMVITLHENDPLAKKKMIDPADLNGLPYLERINCEFGDYGERLFEGCGIQGPTTYQSERDDWVLAMVAAGMGYGFMPSHCVNYPGVVGRALTTPHIVRTVNFVTVRGRPHTPAVGSFVREVMRTRWHGKKAIAVQNIESGSLEDAE